uniref:hypothetical protein n=1 Tax=Vaginimicrobium propionicum TaxID=1871034 RepID=UPI000970B8C4|nr:hypothetical protein [Vaginimicrobium propionicum]
MNKKNHVAADGTVLTEAMIERMASQVEELSDCEFVDEPAPWLAPQPATTHSVQVPEQLWQQIEKAARHEGISVTDYTHQALTKSLQTSH